MTAPASLDPLFYPRSIAIIGASSDARKIGGLPVHLSKLRGYSSPIYPVNPGSPEIQGLKAYPSVAAIDGPVDCAVVAVPAPLVLGAIEDCARKKVRVAVVFSSGFAEAGEEGKRNQDRLAAIAREADMRVIGPNAMGAFSLEPGFIATFTTAFEHHGGKGFPEIGPVSLASQSGAIGIHVMVMLRERGLGLSKWVTTGNQSDIEVSDCISYFAADAKTKTIVAYIEGAKNGRKLADALALARANGKPVVVLKVGTSETGALATAAHTASLAGSDVAYDTLFRQHGAYRASTLAELVDVVAALQHGRYPRERSVGFVSISGGVGALMADKAEAIGLSVPAMPDAAQERMKVISPLAGPRNPIDTAAPGMSDMKMTLSFIETAIADGNYASLCAFLTHLAYIDRHFTVLRPGLMAIRKKYSDRIIALSMTLPADIRNALEKDGFIVCDDPSRAVECVGALWRIGEALRTAAAKAAPPSVPAGALAPARGAAGEQAALAVLASAGIPVVPHAAAESAEDAAAAAARIGFPVALKLASPDIAHKSDIGGVALGLRSAAEVEEAFAAVMARAKKAAPGARLDGVTIARMVSGGVETIMGVNRDPVLGPLVMFGMGGIFVEVFRDVAFRVAPFGIDEAHAMIREIKGFPLLDGARGRPKADVDALANALARLSAYAAANADALQSVDVNPFIVLPNGEGGFAVDALVVPRAETASGSH
ncbi:MAG: acetate--CoA ligase family protein [Alphaproteobacteria bacterium]|nr:acetate--CoA ligase family protein [Alphaproteobacteria bacterium]